MLRSTFSAALVLAVVVVAAACGPDTGPAPDIAQLRVMHVSSGTPAVDVFVEGMSVAQDLDFSRTSAFADVPAGDAAIEIRAADAGGVLDARTVELLGGERYTLLFSNSGSGRITLAADTAVGVPTAPPPTSAADTGAIPGENKVKLRIIHNAPDAPPLDVYLTSADAPLAGALPSIEPFTFGAGLSPEFPGYFERDPGLHRVRFTGDGTQDVVMDTGPIDLQAGRVASVVLFSSDTTGLGFTVVRER